MSLGGVVDVVGWTYAGTERGIRRCGAPTFDTADGNPPRVREFHCRNRRNGGNGWRLFGMGAVLDCLGPSFEGSLSLLC